MAGGVHCNQSASFQVRFGSPNCAEHDVAYGGWQNVLATHLNDAGRFCPRSRQQRTEIQIVRQNSPAVGCGEIKDHGSAAPG